MSDIGGPLDDGGIGVKDDPFALFDAWMDEAKKTEPNEANAMSIATVDAEGRPNVRMVLLKGAEHARLRVLHQSGKRQGHASSRAIRMRRCAFTGRSLAQAGARARRRSTQVSDAEADAYFATRAKDSQIGAWASAQSRPMEGRWAFEKEIAKVRREIRARQQCRGRLTGRASASRRSRSSSGATVRSACTTGWSIAATRRTRPGGRSDCFRERWRPMTPPGRHDAALMRRAAIASLWRVGVSGDDQGVRLFRSPARWRCWRRLRIPRSIFSPRRSICRDPIGADAGRSTSTASATARPSRSRVSRRARSSRARRPFWSSQSVSRLIAPQPVAARRDRRSPSWCVSIVLADRARDAISAASWRRTGSSRSAPTSVHYLGDLVTNAGVIVAHRAGDEARLAASPIRSSRSCVAGVHAVERLERVPPELRPADGPRTARCRRARRSSAIVMRHRRGAQPARSAHARRRHRTPSSSSTSSSIRRSA